MKVRSIFLCGLLVIGVVPSYLSLYAEEGVGNAVGCLTPKIKRLATLSTGTWYGLFSVALMLTANKVTQKTLEYVAPDSAKRIAPLLSVACALPLSSLLLVKYSDLVWYAHAVLYSGEHISPRIAQEIITELRLYVHYLDTLKKMQQDMDQLLADVAVKSASGASSIGLFAKKISQVVESGENYVRSVCQQLDALGLYSEQSILLLMKRGNEVEDVSPLEHIAFVQGLEFDTNSFERLVEDLFEYWQGYLAHLMQGIDAKMLLCQRLLQFENVVTLLLKWPLHNPAVR